MFLENMPVGVLINKLKEYNKELEATTSRGRLCIEGQVTLSNKQFNSAMKRYEADMMEYKLQQLEKKKVQIEKLRQELGEDV